ncbi:MAG: hypothetical protein K8I60_17455 [Anaerolineae bacterium]|nr:hypothetical protein [Anaerolineae bacterium]
MMSDVDVMLRLPETLVEKARAQGLLDNERIARLLTAEIERVEAWQRLDQSLESVRAAFRTDYPDMDEDDVANMLNDLIDEVRAETRDTSNPNDAEG